MQVKLYDRNRGLLDRDDFLGDFVIDKNDIIDNCIHNPGTWQFNKEHDLIKKDKTKKGKILLKIKFVDMKEILAKRKAAANNPVKGTFKLHLIKGV